MSTRESVKKFFFTKKVRILFSAIVGIVLAWFISISSLGRDIELNTLDLQFRFAMNSRQADSSIVILSIDQNSLQYFKRNGPTSWPWPRDFYALTTDYLAKGGAKAIVYDFHFNEPDEDRAGSTGAYNDTLFASAIKNAGNVFLAAQLTQSSEEDQPGDTLLRFPSGGMKIRETKKYDFDKTYSPLVAFQTGARAIGVVNFTTDEDGICRRIPLVYRLHDKEIFSLSYSIYHDLSHAQDPIEQFVQSPYLIYWYGKGGPDGVFKYYSIHAVIVSATKEKFGMTPDIPSSVFRDKIVLIGSNAPGLLDLRPTPFTYLEPYPGVEIHATALSNFLQRHFISEISIIWLVLLSIVASFLISFISNYAESVVTSTVSMLAVLVLLFIGITQLFIAKLLWVKVVFPTFSIVLSYVVSIGWSFATEGRNKRQIQKIFGQFVNPHVVKQLSHDPERVELGGEEVEATIMFSDIEGFTSISETKKPKELVAFLNDYFSVANDIFFKHEGTIDKFIGDAVMVQFGIPLKNPNHRILAVRAAFEFSQTVAEMTKEAKQKGEPVFSTRIGVNTGTMVVGYIGGRSKKEYTVIGDTVNLASRLEGVNKFYGSSLMISEATATDQIRDEFLLREMDLIRVKGKSRPIKIYEVVCKKGDVSEVQLQIVQTFESALKLYREQHWSDAIKIFSTVLQKKENDYASKMYIERCNEFQKTPPDAHWDGVYVFKNK